MVASIAQIVFFRYRQPFECITGEIHPVFHAARPTPPSARRVAAAERADSREDKTEAIRKGASELLGVNCVWVEEEEGTHEILGQAGKPPPI